MSLSSILVPSSGCLFGVYPSSTCFSAATYRQRVLDAETQVLRTAAANGISNVVNTYHDWNDYASTFPTADEQSLVNEGRLLLVHWNSEIFGSTTYYLWADIANGLYDASIVDPFARKVAAWGTKFFFAFFNEMDRFSSSAPTIARGPFGTDLNYAAAAQHIHDRFVALGATNAIWVFKPTGYTATIPTRMNNLYPGDAYVDWIGWDPYSTGASGGWEDLAYTLDTKYPAYTWATSTKTGSHTKPLMLAEWGVQENGGVPNGGTYPDTKAGFFDQLRTLLPGAYPQIKAIIYFASTGPTATCINTSSQALAAFQTLADADYFTPDISSSPPPVGQGTFAGAASAVFSDATSVQVTVPSTVEAGDSLYLLHTSTRSEIRNACEGTNGVAVTTGNSNSAGSNPYDLVSGTVAYDTGTVLDGSSSIKVSTSATSTSVVRWTTSSFSFPTTFRGRLVFQNPSNPPALVRTFQCNDVGGTPRWGVGFDTTGKVVIRDLTAGATRATSTSTPALNTRHRFDFQAAWDPVAATTTVTVQIFLGTNWNGTTPDETLTHATAFAQATGPAVGDFGIHFGTAQTWNCYIDQCALDAHAYPGQVGSSATLTDPTGWSAFTPQLLAAGAAELAGRAYRKVASAGDPGSTLTLTTDLHAHGAVLLLAYAGSDPTTPVDVYASNSRSGDATATTTPNVTTTVAADVIASAAFQRDNPGATTSTWTMATGETQRAAALPSGSGRVAGAASDDGATHAVGTYGSKTFTSNATGYLGVGWTVAVKSTTATSSGQGLGFMSQHN